MIHWKHLEAVDLGQNLIIYIFHKTSDFLHFFPHFCSHNYADSKIPINAASVSQHLEFKLVLMQLIECSL